ncbi:MAG: DNA translocase FtsK [Lachnospiraceae bacterium]
MAAKSKKKRSTRQNNKKNTESGFVKDEILIWLTLAISILILLSNFGIGGAIGEMASSFLKGIFGLVAYVVPFVLFGVVSFLVSNKGNVNAYLKSLAGIVLMILTCTFCQLLNESGGVTGEKIADVLTPAIGIAGTYVVVIIFMIICIVIITGKSALKGVKSQSDKAYSRAKDDAAKHKKAREERRKEKENTRQLNDNRNKQEKKGNRRSDHHVEGVSFDTTLTRKSPDVKELKVEEKEDVMPDFVIQRSEPVMPETSEEAFPPEDIMTTAQEDVIYDKPTGAKKEKTPKTRMGEEAVAKEVAGVAGAVAANDAKPKKAYKYPPISLLKKGDKNSGESDASLRETAMKLQQTLQNFGVNVTVTNVSCGPAVTRYELQPEMGVKVSKIVGLADDIKLNLAAADIRIEAPIPGKAAVGIEVPNKENSVVMLRELLETPEFKNSKSKISFAAGKDIAGKVVVTDIAKMPHLLIAGSTGSGKSVCINTLIMSILYKATPDEVKLIMIDPKVVELSVYNGIPHLMIPVVTDPKKAAGALNWAVAEMTRRYQAFAEHNVRDMKGYNKKIESEPEINGEKPKPMAQIVIIVDELADLMMVASGEVEEAICRLAQLARAAGIHLVVATQRPSVNVITGLIKANMPSRIAFAVSSGVDSRTIIDMNGAEKLLGKGDMLFYPQGYPKPARVQGSFVTDQEVQSVVEYLKSHNDDADYDEEIVNHVNTSEAGVISASASEDGNDRDMYFADAGRLIIDKEKASIGMLQRTFKIGFNRAARIMDQLCEAGVVGGEEGTKPRKVLMSKEEFEQYVEQM